MKINTLKLMSCITPVVVGLLAQSSFANIIPGSSVDFAGTATVDNNNPLSAATTITSINATVDFTSGSFSPALNGLVFSSTGAAANNGAPLTPGLMSGYDFKTASGVTPLWAVTAGGVLYSVNATTLTATFNPIQNEWVIGGNGTITIGADSAFGTWGENINGANGIITFAFDASTDVNAPDGGTTAMLLGGALMGLGLLKRKLMA